VLAGAQHLQAARQLGGPAGGEPSRRPGRWVDRPPLAAGGVTADDPPTGPDRPQHQPSRQVGLVIRVGPDAEYAVPAGPPVADPPPAGRADRAFPFAWPAGTTRRFAVHAGQHPHAVTAAPGRYRENERTS